MCDRLTGWNTYDVNDWKLDEGGRTAYRVCQPRASLVRKLTIRSLREEAS